MLIHLCKAPNSVRLVLSMEEILGVIIMIRYKRKKMISCVLANKVHSLMENRKRKRAEGKFNGNYMSCNEKSKQERTSN